MPVPVLTVRDVYDIRTLRAMNVPLEKLAAKYGVSTSAISRAASGQTFPDALDAVIVARKQA